jgi:hypothetical protein
MHCDNLLAYCPITQIVAMAFRDNAFENKLTPEYFWQLRVPKGLGSLPIRWKEKWKKIPVLRRMHQTSCGLQVHPSLPMRYESSNNALKHIGEGLGYKRPLTHYHFRRWVADEVNRKCF